MGISTEEKEHYLKETAIVLAREGFQTVRTHTGRLRVLLDDTPLCELAESGVTYRDEDVNDPERIDAKDKVYEIARTTAEYVYAADGGGVLFESQRIRGRLQGAGRFQRHSTGRTSYRPRRPVRHLGLGMDTRAYATDTTLWRTMKEPNRTLPSAPD